METGLKRLWTRRKSRGHDTRKDSGVGSVRQRHSTERSQPSATTSPQLLQVRDISTADGTARSRPATADRFQPTLGAGLVSRPSMPRSRPATSGSGSLANAINRAADAVVKAEEEFQFIAERYNNDHTQPKTPRYVDIFSLSSSNSPNPRPGYNEDVAERNLDLVRIALEDAISDYVPSSRYQEEVASRNASPSLRESFTFSPSLRQESLDGSRRGELSPLSPLSPMSTSPRSPQPLEARFMSVRGVTTLNSVGVYPRHQSERSGDSHPRIIEPNGSERTPSAVQRPRTPVGARSPEGLHESPAIPPRHPDRISGDFNIREVLNGALSNYQLSAAEKTQMKSANMAHRPPSREQAHSHSPRLVRGISIRTINLPNRTILDLTSNDVDEYTNQRPLSSYSISPVLEHAQVDTLRKVSGPVSPMSLTDNSPFRSSASRPATAPQPKTEPSTVAEPSHGHNARSDPETGSPIARRIVANIIARSNFTPIITMASASPRTSLVLEIAPAFFSADQLQPILSGERLPDGHPPEPVVANPPENEVATNTDVVAADHSDASVKSSSTTIQSTLSHSTEVSAQTNEPQTSMPTASAESITKPSGLLGVRTLDFAPAVLKSILKKIPEASGLTSSGTVDRTERTSYRRTKSSEISGFNTRIQAAPLYKSTFDEVEFAKKQNEAREALIRLQLSLNEDFLTQPLPPAITKTARPSIPWHSYSFSDGKPAAPSSLFTPIRESSPDPGQTRGEPQNKTEETQPSYHRKTTIAQHIIPAARPDENSRPATEKPTKQRKGKQRSNSELNGPGPSVTTDAPKTHSSLPSSPGLQSIKPAFRPFVSQPHHGVPPSPGEISLSNFPFPTGSFREALQTGQQRSKSRPGSRGGLPHGSPDARPGTMRRKSSVRSYSSSTSAFSIPIHMIPDRSSSIRD